MKRMKMSALVLTLVLLVTATGAAALSSISFDRDVDAGLVLADTDENVAVQFTDLIEYDDFMVTAASGEVAFNLNAAINAAGGTERGFNPDALFTIGDVDTGAFTITNNSDIPVVVSFSDDDSENTPLSLEAVEAYEIPVGETYGFYFDLETTELSDQDALGGTLSVRGGDAIQ